MQIAEEAQARFGRKVTWGASCGNTTRVFTSLSVPVMTRLRQGERQVLDTLVEAGVARSRSDALAWSVRLVGQHQREWIDELREALVAVEAARASGPTP
jgi:Arc/MetJ-type ribon-helix-helix transcriptional regulator